MIREGRRAMSENLARASTILLFGRVLEDIQINTARGSGASAKRTARSASLEHSGPSHALAEQIAAEGSCLARIYAFSYEGTHYELSRATLYLVHGPGDAVADNLETSGAAAATGKFASDVRVWAYDKADISVRLDVETGTLEQILLESEVDIARLKTHFAGQKARLRPNRNNGGND
jgi:hypothetical protein